MHKIYLLVCGALLCFPAIINVLAVEAGRRVVIYDNLATEVESPSATFSVANPDDLWVTLADLKRATQFELKPQGVCRDELCFPIPKARRSAFLSKQGSITWFNLSEFARLLRQPVAFDTEQAVWYFGPRSDVQNSYVNSLIAPDFTLPDMNGKQHSLSNFRGKKVLLLTWASW
jgi:AhpC/TSA family